MIKPVREHLLIKIVDDTKKTTASGIILKTAQVQKQCIGEVVAIGQGRMLGDGTYLPSVVKINDRIIFYDYAGVKVEHESNDTATYLLIKENDVLAVIEN